MWSQILLSLWLVLLMEVSLQAPTEKKGQAGAAEERGKLPNPEIGVLHIPELEISEPNFRRDIDLDFDTPIGDDEGDIGRLIRDIDLGNLEDLELGYGRDHRAIDESQYPPPRDGTEDGNERYKRGFDLNDLGDLQLGYGRDHRSVDQEPPPIGEGIDGLENAEIERRNIPYNKEKEWPPVIGESVMAKPRNLKGNIKTKGRNGH